MPAPMGSNFWTANFPGGVGNAAAPAYGGGGSIDMISARSELDGARMANGFAPGASYPDGYLGYVGDRHQDKIRSALNSRMKSTSYVRGVHAGTKQPKGAYYWDEDMDPQMGLQRQLGAVQVMQEGAPVWSSKRHAPRGNPVEMLTNDGKYAGATTREIEAELRRRGGDPAKNPVTIMDPARAAKMGHMLPPWSGVRPGAL